MKLNLSQLKTWLQKKYFSDKQIELSLIRSYTNDVYLVVVDNNKYVLKIYGKAWRDKDSINWEVELVNFVNSNKKIIPSVVSGNDGNFINKIQDYLCVLSEYADGKKPQSPFSEDQYFLFGRSIAIFHNASDGFKTKYNRRDIDLNYLVDKPVELALSYIGDKEELVSSLLNSSKIVKTKIEQVKDKLDWGPIHGDATFDNLHITENNKIILYDFDSGGMGWRATDIQGWAVNNPEFKLKYDKFIDGYKSVRKLNTVDIEISPYITVAWEIWGLEVELNNRIIKQGGDKIQEYLNNRIQSISNLTNKL